MATPTKYAPNYSFAGFQASDPDAPLPAQRVDDELARIALSVGEAVDALALVQRSDGKLANQSVGPDQLSPSLTIGFTNRGTWAIGNSYLAGDGVSKDGTFYSAKVANVSTAGNAPGVDATTWNFLFTFTAIATTDGSITEASLDPAFDAALARLASPTFTGTPAAPTAPTNTNTTQLATTAFVTAAVSPVAMTASAALPASAVDTDGSLSSNSDIRVASQKAVRTYADTKLTAAAIHAFGLGVTSATAPAATASANTLLTSGVYTVPATWTGSPLAGTQGDNQGYLEVQPFAGDATYCRQTFTSISGIKYTRVLIANTWSSWATAPAGGQPIPTSSLFGVGTLALCAQSSGGSIADGGTVAGAYLKLASASASAWGAAGGSQSGTWKNITGISVVNTSCGYFVRTA